jgi:murein L,D-transpeptidase YcbB/YkuD
MILVLGCATTRKGQDIQTQQLKARINFLEEELHRKDEEIRSLENELTRLSSSKQRAGTQDIVPLRLSAKQIQTALKNSGFYKGKIDGKIGPQTKEAIKAFQKAHGLKADGIVGKRTAEKISKYLP